MLILGIETSCDETAAAVVRGGRELLSNVISSQIDLHKLYGGVVPELAARSHIEAMLPVIEQALTEAETDWDQIDAIAVTRGPGLGGSLLVGVLTARTLAVVKEKPLYGVHHVEGHVYANFLSETPPQFPLLALVVSGGHTQLMYWRDHFDFEVIGRTQDDAVGEAFDKVAKVLGLPYPGGPSISQAARNGDPKAFAFPKARMEGVYDFSFSGLKTAVLRRVQELCGKDYSFPSHELAGLLKGSQQADIAASFQHIACETLVDKTEAAVNQYQPTSVVVAGGVAANQELRRQLSERLGDLVQFVPPVLCTDNGAMIAALGSYYHQLGRTPDDPRTLTFDPNWRR